jgi:hypothetical protein
MKEVKTFVGGCSWSFGGLLGTWTLAGKCREAGKCSCIGETSPHLLDGSYPGFGKRA